MTLPQGESGPIQRPDVVHNPAKRVKTQNNQESCHVEASNLVGKTVSNPREKETSSQPTRELDMSKSEEAKGGLNPTKSVVRGVSC